MTIRFRKIYFTIICIAVMAACSREKIADVENQNQSAVQKVEEHPLDFDPEWKAPIILDDPMMVKVLIPSNSAEQGIYYNERGSSTVHNNKIYYLFGDNVQNKYNKKFAIYSTPFESKPNAAFSSPTPSLEQSIESGDIPSGAVSVNNDLYVFFSGYRCTIQGTSAEAMGRSYLAKLQNGAFVKVHSSDNNPTGTFSAFDFSTFPSECKAPNATTPSGKFINVSPAIAKSSQVGFTDSGRDSILIFGTGLWRRSAPYLARANVDQVDLLGRYQFWNGSSWTAQESDAKPLFNSQNIGEMSVKYIPSLSSWLMLYMDYPLDPDAAPSLVYRTAKLAVGPWTEKQVLIGPGSDIWNDLLAVHADGSDPDAQANISGSLIAPHIVDAYTQGDANLTDIYFKITARVGGSSIPIISRVAFTTSPTFMNAMANDYYLPAIKNEYNAETTAYTLVNMESADPAKIHATYFGGGRKYKRDLTAAAQTGVSVWQGADIISKGKKLSAHFKSDKKLAGHLNASETDTKMAYGIEILSKDDASNKLFAPLSLSNYHDWSSRFVIQNVSTQSTSYKIVFYFNRIDEATGQTIPSQWEYSSPDLPATLTPGFRLNIDTSKDDLFTAISDKVSSMVVTATDPKAKLIGFVISMRPTKGMGAAYPMIPSHAGADSVFVPEYHKLFQTRNSNIIVQNMGESNTDITISMRVDGSRIEKSYPGVRPGQAIQNYLGAFSDIPDGTRGSAHVTSSNAKVGVTYMTSTPDESLSASTSSFRANILSSKLLFPRVYNNHHDWDSTISVQNAGAELTSLKATIHWVNNGQPETKTEDLGEVSPKDSIHLNSSQLQIPDGIAATVTIESENGSNIVGKINQDNKTDSFSFATQGYNL